MKVNTSEAVPSEESNYLPISDSMHRFLLQPDTCLNSPISVLIHSGSDVRSQSHLKVATEVSESELVDRYSLNCGEDDYDQDDISIYYPKVDEIVARYASQVEPAFNDDIIILHPNDDDIIRRYAPQSMDMTPDWPVESEISEAHTTCDFVDSENSYHESNSSAARSFTSNRSWLGNLLCDDNDLLDKIDQDSNDNTNAECTDDDELVQDSDFDRLESTKKEEFANEIPNCDVDDECCSTSCGCALSRRRSAVESDGINSKPKIELHPEVSEAELLDEREGFGDPLDDNNDLARERLTEEFDDSCYDSVDADDAIPMRINPSSSPIPRRNITVYNVCCDKDFFTSISIDRKKETAPARKSCQRDMLNGFWRNISHSKIFEGAAGNIRKSYIAKKFKDKNKFKRQLQSDHLLNVILALEKAGQKFESFCIHARRSLRKSNSAGNVLKTGTELKEELTPLLEQQLSLIQKIRTSVQ